MEQQKTVRMMQIVALSVQNDSQKAEIEHLRVTFESHMKLQKQNIES